MSDGFKRNASVDLLKGVAILMVIVTHLGFTADQRKYFAFPFWIDMAVPVFMMLMGYVMSMSYARHGVDSLLTSGVVAVAFCVAVGVCFDGISRKLVTWSDVCLFSWINVLKRPGGRV